MITRRSFVLSVSAAGLISFPGIPTVTESRAQGVFGKALVAKSKLSSRLWQQHNPTSTVGIDHSAWDSFLAKHVSTDGNGVNRVSYGAVTESDRQLLENYLNLLQATDVVTLNRDEQYAFWINLYNAAMVKTVLDHYPVKSVFDIKSGLLDAKGPFNDVVAVVKGQKLTLDTIESGIVRPLWNDPRLHYVFNCAAMGCPNLGQRAYRGATINVSLDEAASAYVNNPRGIRISGGRVIASKIYYWYSEDFGNDEKAVLDHIRSHASEKLVRSLNGLSRIDAYEYDWALNGR